MNWRDEDLDFALRDLREDALPEIAVTALHARVMAGVRASRPRWWRWAWAPVAAAAVVAAVMIWPQRADVLPPPLVASAPGVPPAAWVKPEPAPRPPAAQTEVASPGAPPQLEATDTPGMVRIASRDPNIVILWSLNNGEGDSSE